MKAALLTVPEKVVETMLAYYRQATTLPESLEELAEWVNTLSLTQQEEILFIDVPCLLVLPAFRRYVLEKRGFWMNAYMASHLTADEFSYWLNSPDGGRR